MAYHFQYTGTYICMHGLKCYLQNRKLARIMQQIVSQLAICTKIYESYHSVS